MSAAVKKPPLAPKPKLPVNTTKASPPPIAPKPGLHSQSIIISQSFPGTLNRIKPAVAPKPCIPKSVVCSRPASPPKPSGVFIHSQKHKEGLDDNHILLISKNGILSETSNHELEYIIPSCSCRLQDCSQCEHLENGNAAGTESELHKNQLQNGISPEGYDFRGTQPQEKAEIQEDGASLEKDNGEEISKNFNPKPRNKPQRQRHLVTKEAHRPDEQTECSLGQSFAFGELEVGENHLQIEAHNTELKDNNCKSVWDVVGSNIVSPNPTVLDLPFTLPSPELLKEESERSIASPARLFPDLKVPAPPSKPLPVPHPRKLKKPTLVRQNGVEGGAFDLIPEEQKKRLETRDEEEKLSVAGLSLSLDSDELKDGGSTRPLSQQDICTVEPNTPVPPLRQTSLSSHLYRTIPVPPLLGRDTSHSLDLLSQSDPLHHDGKKEGKVHQVREDEEDGYGDFELYPITHSLPKQLRLGCHPSLSNTKKAFSAEDQQSPMTPPRKPQRHSLPAPPPPSIIPPAPPHGNIPMRALPAPPTEKTTWRFSRPSVTFFSRQMPTRSSVPPKSRAPVLGGKQRAQSFSAADLATRSDTQKRGLSFRKLLELRLPVKMLPKLLTKGAQSLDCTSVESNRRDRRMERPKSCIGESEYTGEGEGSVEYENVPLYEEIPEYMNLPFHSARLGWPHDLDSPDSDVYEVQDPYHKCHDLEYESSWLRQDVHSEEEEEIHSSDEEDNSSTSSKEHLDEADRQEDEMKRKKVVHIAQEIMSSEKVFVDVLKLLHIDFRDAVAKATRQNGKPVVEERVLSQILYYLPQLYQLNRDLLRELEDRVAHWSDHQRLSDIFVQKGPYLKMYSTYIRQFDNNVALLDEQCRKNTAFASVVREFEVSPRCASLALKHYLLKPVQRIPQYQLLLTDYLKNLLEDSEDYKDTQAALSIVKEVANHANDIMKQGDNFQKLMQIQYSLNGHHEIVQPGRVFLKEGTLMKLSRKVMQPRMFFLFNDALMYTTPVQSGQYKLNCILSLAGMKVSKPSQEAYQNELNIESVERSFILSASSATERDEWLEAITKAIDDYTKKKITFISSRSQEEADGLCDSGALLGSKAPIWIPDLRATMCMICTCEFTLTWRRHHCRACGKVVCQACSANKYYLEYLKNQPARVCDHCFTKLQENSDRCASASLSPIKSGAFPFTRKHKKIPAALKEVSANTENSSMSGYLNRSKGNKKPWKRLWFVIKNKVLYTYAASEDVAALESQPLLGFFLREEKNGPAQKLQFKLYHKNTLFYIFRADDIPTAQRWIEAFQEAMILEQE
ncbi:FYVE, RhoGEF and PH domain-containing protein 6 isoform X2 [Thalassophryne amazonica]|uniref:FYVE, RhoGEF and PH domain-containing protein 6 isoform X2 n=1 Tax=Thalassophryne amazonica TaxID=390379 RepID=UPI0014721D7F|nr:FYVE, RhoGEF and PH domain-containing protein 6 isoform X2 [Thalassophryne amazonica]